MPSLFPYQNVNEGTYVDGGAVINVDIVGAIQRCENDGFDEKDIIVDVLLCWGMKDVSPLKENAKT
jgi:hypothetical protein